MNKNEMTIVGMGYVGMPIAIEFSKHMYVNGFDINEEKIEQYKLGNDPTNEIGGKIIQESNVNFTADERCISHSEYIIVAVPTPIDSDKTPNLVPIISASETVGRNLSKGSYVIFESTVYPGVTESICVPILEEESGLRCGVDFHIGYSPERINPGDSVHKLSNIKKIVSGGTKESLEKIAELYEQVVQVGVVKVSNIKTAEATKVIENSQRDVNIAFMNEVAMIFNEMDIDTLEVVEAMNSKWNALGFTPGLVGGHCIGVDPYYFIYEAEKLGYHSELISSGRRINDRIPSFVADNTVKQLIKGNKKVKGSKLLVYGLAFKENTPDCRNSKIAELVQLLEEYEIEVSVIDPLVDANEAYKEYGISLTEEAKESYYDGVVFGVRHDVFKGVNIEKIMTHLKNNEDEKDILIDIKGNFSYSEINEQLLYWRL